MSDAFTDMERVSEERDSLDFFLRDMTRAILAGTARNDYQLQKRAYGRYRNYLEELVHEEWDDFLDKIEARDETAWGNLLTLVYHTSRLRYEWGEALRGNEVRTGWREENSWGESLKDASPFKGRVLVWAWETSRYPLSDDTLKRLGDFYFIARAIVKKCGLSWGDRRSFLIVLDTLSDGRAIQVGKVYDQT